MWFEDLSPYRNTPTARSGGTLWGRRRATRVLNVGWLDDSHPFDVGDTSALFQRVLKVLAEHPVQTQSAEQTCALCSGATGSGEVRVSDGEITYVAPQLIFHYVTEHQYRPPEVFVRVVSGAGRAS